MADGLASATSSNSLGNVFKRPRTDDGPSIGTPLDGCARSPNFWHDEGSIILRVDDTLFRVHRDILSTHFTVFKDAFGLPQPGDPEQLQGCQVIALSGDRRDEWETVLTFMYSPLDLHPWHNHLKMQQLLSLARVAHKYQGDKLLTECVSRLKVEFPTKLHVFQKLYPPRIPVPIIHGRAALVKNIDDMINLINNALDLEIECILPCAYYLMLIKFKPQDITDPVIGPDGTTIVLRPTAQRALFQGSSRVYPALLKSVQRWMLPQSTDWPWWCRIEHEYARGVIEGSELVPLPECHQDFDAVRSRIIEQLYQCHDSQQMLLASFERGQSYGHIFLGLCEACQCGERNYREPVQLQFWVNLPNTFGMGKSWKDLKYF